jgi:hypothetical protein
VECLPQEGAGDQPGSADLHRLGPRLPGGGDRFAGAAPATGEGAGDAVGGGKDQVEVGGSAGEVGARARAVFVLPAADPRRGLAGDVRELVAVGGGRLVCEVLVVPDPAAGGRFGGDLPVGGGDDLVGAFRHVDGGDDRRLPVPGLAGGRGHEPSSVSA